MLRMCHWAAALADVSWADGLEQGWEQRFWHQEEALNSASWWSSLKMWARCRGDKNALKSPCFVEQKDLEAEKQRHFCGWRWTAPSAWLALRSWKQSAMHLLLPSIIQDPNSCPTFCRKLLPVIPICTEFALLWIPTALETTVVEMANWGLPECPPCTRHYSKHST